MFIELHILQNFGPSCLNRDDTNTPKDCQFGGYRRARISSQCMKRAVREFFKDNISELDGKMGVRTRSLPKRILEKINTAGKSEEDIKEKIPSILKELGLNADKKKPEKTDVMLFLSSELDKDIAQLIIDNWEDFTSGKGKTIGKKAEKLLKKISEEIENDNSADIALFGRMVASNVNYKVDAAAYVAHAISTHSINMEMDFFTAIDDLQEDEESGAGMMGTIMYNSACYYRYAVIDTKQLEENLGVTQEDQYIKSTLKAFAESFIKAIPTGKQTSMAAFNQPSFVMATVRDDQPWSLANSFAEPVWIGSKTKTSYIKESIKSLDDFYSKMRKMYGDKNIQKTFYCTMEDIDKLKLNEFATNTETIDKLITNLGDAINGSNSS